LCYRHEALEEQRAAYAARLAEAREHNTRRAGEAVEVSLLQGEANTDEC